MKESVTPASEIIPEKVNYPQLDTIRFLTISIIVWSHSLFQEWYTRIPLNTPGEIIQVIVIQIGAMSTVIFFIVSGILMNAKIKHYNFRRYLTERIPRVYAPWVFIVFINAILIAAHQLYAQEIRLTWDLNQLMTIAYNIMTALLIYGPYWFVVTYFIGMMILILFKRYSSNVYFGMVLLLVTLFYGLNFYMEWIDTLHTKAVLAYTFFIWLGFQIQSRWDDNLKKVNEIKWILLVPLLILLFGAATFDGYQLSKEGVKDPYASNRLINIAFSLVFFIALVKMGEIRRINKLQPRKIVFGIYLVNSIIVLELTYLFHEHLNALSSVHIWALLGLQIIYFSFVLFLTWLIVDYIARSHKLRWIIGGTSSIKKI
jgi:hypothetical protein